MTPFSFKMTFSTSPELGSMVMTIGAWLATSLLEWQWLLPWLPAPLKVGIQIEYR